MLWENEGKPTLISRDSDRGVEYLRVLEHYTRCLLHWFSEKYSVFHICGKKGMLEGKDTFFTLFFMKSKEERKSYFEKDTNGLSKFITKIESKAYLKIVGPIEKSICNKKYKLSTNDNSADFGTDTLRCGRFKNDKGKMIHRYCGELQSPFCNTLQGVCVGAKNEFTELGDSVYNKSDPMYRVEKISCRCPNREVYFSLCYGKCERAAYCEGGIPGKVEKYTEEKWANEKMHPGFVRCAPILQGRKSKKNILIGQVPEKTKIGDRNELNPFSLNEVPAKCLVKNLREARDWIKDQKAWYQFKSTIVETTDKKNSKYFGYKDYRIVKLRGVIPAFKEYDQANGEVYQSVISAKCGCGSRKFDVWTSQKEIYNDWTNKVNTYNFDKKNKDGYKAIEVACQRLSKLCINGQIVPNSCQSYDSRFSKKTIKFVKGNSI